jgi:hypothetical protein
MFTLDVGVRAVVFAAGKLLLTRFSPDQPAWECVGSGFVMGKTLPAMVEDALAARIALPLAATKLLYIVERFISRDSTDVHLLEHYYLCELTETNTGQLAAAVATDADLALLGLDELSVDQFSPACLHGVLAADAAERFNVSPKLIVDNQLGAKSAAASGVFRA